MSAICRSFARRLSDRVPDPFPGPRRCPSSAGPSSSERDEPPPRRVVTQSAAHHPIGMTTAHERRSRFVRPMIQTTGSRLSAASAGVRIAIIDVDSGFLHVLGRRLKDAGRPYAVLTSPVRAEALVEIRLDALVVDFGVLGDAGWSYLATVAERLPRLGVVVCTGPSSVARVRGLRRCVRPPHAAGIRAAAGARVRKDSGARAGG